MSTIIAVVIFGLIVVVAILLHAAASYRTELLELREKFAVVQKFADQTSKKNRELVEAKEAIVAELVNLKSNTSAKNGKVTTKTEKA